MGGGRFVSPPLCLAIPDRNYRPAEEQKKVGILSGNSKIFLFFLSKRPTHTKCPQSGGSAGLVVLTKEAQNCTASCLLSFCLKVLYVVAGVAQIQRTVWSIACSLAPQVGVLSRDMRGLNHIIIFCNVGRSSG